MTDYRNAETLKRLYWEEDLSIQDIANKAGICIGTVQYWMDKHDIERRAPDREKPPYFQHADDHGHEMIRTLVDGKVKAVGVHPHVAVSEFGTDAVAGMHVHHKNGIPWDNRPENLQPMTNSDHITHHNIARGKRGGVDD